ncbi:hypothetical protein OTB19_33175 [Streptomyces sp. H27-H5]|nr:hypothetical protein [Streptomyces sp. H27-H5]MCY0961717.1 hypothetical protein [Streptomyces sp. H27-H5]
MVLPARRADDRLTSLPSHRSSRCPAAVTSSPDPRPPWASPPCPGRRAALLTGLHTGHAAVRANPDSGGQGANANSAFDHTSWARPPITLA